MPDPVPNPRTITRLRSLLFAPASRADVLAKLPRSGPDGVVLDLEDAVPANAKVAARPNALAAGDELSRDHPHLAIYVRVNAVATEWFADDIALGLSSSITGIIVPKLESPDQADTVRAALTARDLGHLSIFAGVETALGVTHADALFAHPGVDAAYFGAEDYVADLGGVRTDDNLEVLYARSRVALAARVAGVYVLDQVVTRLDDEGRFRRDAAQGRALGYRGKLCIHPSQVKLANETFSSSPEEVARAERLLAAYDEAVSRGEAAIAFEGQMVDEPLARQARTVLASADPTS
jgi:citrate lyase subunit beta/citryl-CoA lyase